MRQFRRTFGSPFLAAAIALAVAAPAAEAARKHDDTYDQFVVKFKDGTEVHRSAAARQRVLDGVGHRQGLRVGQVRRMAVGADVIRTDRRLQPAEIKAFIRQLRSDPNVEYAEADARVYPAMTPNDTSYFNQWHYFEATAGINAEDAWDMSTGTGQVVAVLDTGIVSHTDLNANVVGGYDFITSTAMSGDGNGRDADASDPGDYTGVDECGIGWPGSESSWHGTHVSGTIAAVTNNAKGVAGVAHGAKVLNLRVLGKCGGVSSDISDAIIWASGGSISGVPANANVAKVINLSLGGGGSCTAGTQAAINTANTNGSVVVIAAGNDNDDASNYQPANCLNVITVGAHGRTGARASYSNYGSIIDLSAPGGNAGDIYSTLNSGTTVPVAENYEGYQGTSMATPHVAGVAALVRAGGGSALTAAQMESLLEVTARSQPVPCTLGCGAGMLDAHAAVLAVNDGPVLNITDAAHVVEGNSGTHVLTFTVNLSAPLGSPVTFDIATANGTATSGSDYVAKTSLAQSIAAGATSKTFTVTVNGDTTAEDDEVFYVNLTNFGGAAVTVIDDQGLGHIPNDDVWYLSNGVPITGLAGAAGSDRRFQMPVPDGATNVSFALSGGTGDADIFVKFNEEPTIFVGGQDCYSANGGNEELCEMTDPVGAGTYHVLVNGYTAYSGLSIVGSYTSPEPDMSIADIKVAESDSGTRSMTFTVSLSEASASPVTFNIATANGTAKSGTDYVAKSLTGQTIAAGALTKTFIVTFNGDTEVEPNETLYANITNVVGANLVDSQARATILNDDGPYMYVTDVATPEGNSGTKTITFTVRLSEAAAVPVTYTATTSNATATSGSDYVYKQLTGETIPAGQTSRPFTVTINGDTAKEGNEVIRLTLSALTGASMYDDIAGGTITNDDGPRLSVNNVSVTEGNSGTKTMTFTVSTPVAHTGTIGYTIATGDTTATVANNDYVAKTSTGQTIAAGVLSRTFTVTINGDGVVEPNETMKATISNVTGATIYDAVGVGTITNDD